MGMQFKRIAATLLVIGLMVGSVSVSGYGLSADEALEDLRTLTKTAEQNGSAFSYDYPSGIYNAVLGNMAPGVTFYTEEEYQEFFIKEPYQGIGVWWGYTENDKVQFTDVQMGSPADKAGVKAGDILLSISEFQDRGDADNQILALNYSGIQTFTLNIQRAGKTLSTKVTTTIITPTAVVGRIMENGVGYIRIISLTDQSVTEMADTVTTLREKGMTKLVLDLRGVTDGRREAMEKISEQILPKGTVVDNVMYNGQTSKYTVVAGTKSTMPTAVLINDGSANEAIVLAAAIGSTEKGADIGMNSQDDTPTAYKFIKISDPSGYLVMEAGEYFNTGEGNDVYWDHQPEIIVRGYETLYNIIPDPDSYDSSYDVAKGEYGEYVPAALERMVYLGYIRDDYDDGVFSEAMYNELAKRNLLENDKLTYKTLKALEDATFAKSQALESAGDDALSSALDFLKKVK